MNDGQFFGIFFIMIGVLFIIFNFPTSVKLTNRPPIRAIPLIDILLFKVGSCIIILSGILYSFWSYYLNDVFKGIVMILISCNTFYMFYRKLPQPGTTIDTDAITSADYWNTIMKIQLIGVSIIYFIIGAYFIMHENF